MKPKLSDERKLMNYWGKKVKETDFAHVVERAERGHMDDLAPKQFPKTQDFFTDIAIRIMGGFPLTKQEYYIAVALKYFVVKGDMPPYLTFYKKHWHENANHRSYNKPCDCQHCKKKC